jgi:sporulation protein YlmC with PRC-barrel domain
MKKISIIISLMILGIFISGSFVAAEMGAMKMTSSQAFKATDLIGADVRNMQGESLGSIKDLAINSRGNVVFAVISRGLSGKLIPVPASVLKIEENGKIVRLDITAEKLESAPSFTSSTWPDMANRQWAEDTYKYYGVSPTWKEHEPGMEPAKEMMQEKKMKHEKY